MYRVSKHVIKYQVKSVDNLFTLMLFFVLQKFVTYQDRENGAAILVEEVEDNSRTTTRTLKSRSYVSKMLNFYLTNRKTEMFSYFYIPSTVPSMLHTFRIY